MDISNSGSELFGANDAAVLRVLAGVSTDLSGRRIALLAGVSAATTHRILSRLVSSGLLTADPAGGAILYKANRHHILWSAVETIIGARATFLESLTSTVAGHAPERSTAFLFGSVARRDSDTSSDIDLGIIVPNGTPTAVREDLLGAVHEEVERLTGNSVQLFVLDDLELGEMARNKAPLLDAWLADVLHIYGISLDTRAKKSGKLWAA